MKHNSRAWLFPHYTGDKTNMYECRCPNCGCVTDNHYSFYFIIVGFMSCIQWVGEKLFHCFNLFINEIESSYPPFCAFKFDELSVSSSSGSCFAKIYRERQKHSKNWNKSTFRSINRSKIKVDHLKLFTYTFIALIKKVENYIVAKENLFETDTKMHILMGKVFKLPWTNGFFLNPLHVLRKQKRVNLIWTFTAHNKIFCVFV